MGVGWLGFAKGASKAGLDSIVAREEKEAEKELEKLKERLRRETAEFDRIEDEKVEIRKEKRTPKVAMYDDDSGETWMLNAFNEEVPGTRRKMSPDDIRNRANKRREEEQGLRKGDLENKKLEAQILTEGAQRGYYSRGNRDSGGRGGSGGSLDGSSAPTSTFGRDEAAARQLVTEYNQMVTDALRGQTGISRAEVEQIALGMVGTSRTGDEARKRFREYLTNLSIRRPVTKPSPFGK